MWTWLYSNTGLLNHVSLRVYPGPCPMILSRLRGEIWDLDSDLCAWKNSRQQVLSWGLVLCVVGHVTALLGSTWEISQAPLTFFPPRRNMSVFEKNEIYSHTKKLGENLEFPGGLWLRLDFPGGSGSKASVYNAGDPGSIPGLGRRKWQSTPVLLPGKSHGQRSLVGYSPWGHKELDTTEWLHFTFCCQGPGLHPCLRN